jgi:TatA/E family protein of Tat protein translocase
MFSLSPVKLLIVLVVALILLGPDKLPQVARQLGAGWRALRDLHQRVERGVRETLPDLPSTTEIARMARSPVALLNQLADLPAPGSEPAVPDRAATADPPQGGTWAGSSTAGCTPGGCR